MAELAKKLHFLKNGTEQTAKAYSTTDEAGDNYVPLKIDSVACYAPIGATDDAMATNGRVIKGGTTYAIKSQAKPPYTEVKYTTAGTHTFTVPNGVTRMRVAVCGGGAGGFACNPITSRAITINSGTGGTSSFGNLLSATGGTGHKYVNKYYDDYGEYDFTLTFGNAGTPDGNKGKQVIKTKNIGTTAGGSGFLLSFTKGTGTYGKGGDVSGQWMTYMNHYSGSSGGYRSGYVTVVPNSTYTVTVGAGGVGKANDSKADNQYGKAGNSGFVFIAYGGDI